MVFLLKRDFEKNHTGKPIGLRGKSSRQKRERPYKDRIYSLTCQLGNYAERLVHSNHIFNFGGVFRGYDHGTSYNPPVKREVKSESESRHTECAILRINWFLQPGDRLFDFLDESPFSTNFESNRYVYPVCPISGAIHHP
jgi:hypothetical protein